jgi:hypothetical protein
MHASLEHTFRAQRQACDAVLALANVLRGRASQAWSIDLRASAMLRQMDMRKWNACGPNFINSNMCGILLSLQHHAAGNTGSCRRSRRKVPHWVFSSFEANECQELQHW